jgi:hypothetical protein
MFELPTPLQHLEPALSALDEADQARTALSKQPWSPMGSTELDRAQRELDQIRVNSTAVLAREAVIGQIHETDDSLLTPPQKVIAHHIVGSPRRPNAQQAIEHIEHGFTIFERITHDVEQYRGTVATIGMATIALYDMHGADNLITLQTNTGQPYSFGIKLENGQQVTVPRLDQPKTFPDVQPQPATYWRELLGHSHDGYADEQLEGVALTDQASKNVVPLIHFGTESNPQADPNEYVVTDEQRFAMRMLIRTLSKDSWLHVTPPSEDLKRLTVTNISGVYLDLITGLVPRDKRPQQQGSYDGFSQRTNVYTTYDRAKSLADYTLSQRDVLCYAAGINPEEVEAYTREQLHKLVETADTPAKIMQTLVGWQHIDHFFVHLSQKRKNA